MLDVLIVFMALNCTADYSPDYWSLFNEAMIDQWNITAAAFCYEVDSYPTERAQLYSLRDSWNLPNGTQSVFITPYEPGIHNSQITRGVAILKDDIAFVQSKPNGRTLSETTSHEILHLVLEEQGYDKSCYSNKVHRFAYREPLAVYVEHWIFNHVEIVSRFSC